MSIKNYTEVRSKYWLIPAREILDVLTRAVIGYLIHSRLPSGLYLINSPVALACSVVVSAIAAAATCCASYCVKGLQLFA